MRAREDVPASAGTAAHDAKDGHPARKSSPVRAAGARRRKQGRRPGESPGKQRERPTLLEKVPCDSASRGARARAIQQKQSPDRETDRRPVNKATLDAKANGVCTVQKHTRQLEWPAMQLSFARREGTRDPAETVARQQTERPTGVR